MKTTINVTQAHINAGKPGIACACPIALAARVAFPNAFAVEVDANTLEVFVEDTYHSFPLPISAETFVRDFDYDLSVQPFSFEAFDPRS